MTQRETSQRGGVAATRKGCSLMVRGTWRHDAAHTQLCSSTEAVGQFEGSHKCPGNSGKNDLRLTNSTEEERSTKLFRKFLHSVPGSPQLAPVLF